MASNLPTPNLDEIARLIFEAERKLEWWHQKIRACTGSIEALERKLLPITAALQYAERSTERRNLVGLFHREGEYGLPLDFPDDVMAALRSRSSEIKQRIEEFQRRKAERGTEVEFIKTDIELLKQVQALNLEQEAFEFALHDV